MKEMMYYAGEMCDFAAGKKHIYIPYMLVAKQNY